MGKVRSEEVVPYYRAARVLLLPSAYEGLPMVLLEAMREGLPVVATSVSGHPDAIEDGVNGFLVQADNTSEFASRAADLLVNHDLRRAMSEQCRKVVVDRFGIRDEVIRYTELYERLVGNEETIV